MSGDQNGFWQDHNFWFDQMQCSTSAVQPGHTNAVQNNIRTMETDPVLISNENLGQVRPSSFSVRSPDPDLSAIIDDLMDMTDEGIGISHSEDERKKSDLLSKPQQRHDLQNLEFLETKLKAMSGDAEVKQLHVEWPAEFCWIDVILRRSSIPRDVPNSETWISSLLNKPAAIPVEIPRMDFSQIPQRKRSL